MISVDHREAVMARAASRDIVVLGPRRKARLEAIVRRSSAPQALVRRARIAPLGPPRWPKPQIAAELGCTGKTVRAWGDPFSPPGMPSLPDRPPSCPAHGNGPG